MHYTILGGSGFIGQALVQRLREKGHSVFSPSRGELAASVQTSCGGLGHVIYCIGLTADFRKRPLQTMEAHCCLLKKILQRCTFDSLTYLSSTRVYASASCTREDQELRVRSQSLDSLYNLSKLCGESLCLQGCDRARSVRLSNVYAFEPASESFLGQILYEAVTSRKVLFRSSPESAKDYISLDDVLELLPRLAVSGEFSVYNLAAGLNTSNQELADCLRQQGIVVDFAADAQTWSFPSIDISRLTRSFDSPSRRLVQDFPAVFSGYWKAYNCLGQTL